MVQITYVQVKACHQDTHTGTAYLFYYTEQTPLGKITMKTTMTAGRSSENGGRLAGGNFAGGLVGMANLCKPITAYDFQVRYNNKYFYTSCICIFLYLT